MGQMPANANSHDTLLIVVILSRPNSKLLKFSARSDGTSAWLINCSLEP